MPLTRFHPTVARWFESEVGEPTAAQREGWAAIAQGEHTLIAAPTGTGKTLAAFLWALDGLLRRGDDLERRCTVLYISPLRALSHDVQKNLAGPLARMRELDPSLPELSVAVRTGDTSQSERASMLRGKRPHVLVTTPESLYILLTSAGGRGLLRDVRTVIVDEIHALARDKRGSHLALSLERLEELVASEPEADGAKSAASGSRLQRIGLSATQKPLDQVAKLLVGTERRCELVDIGHLRRLDLGVETTSTPLQAVCSHEHWGELYARMAELIAAHRTTLIFVNTRKLAERLAARLTEAVKGSEGDGDLAGGASRTADSGAERVVACHHGSLSKELRLQAEQDLKAGKLRALVATASLELGLDIGDIDLVIQVGSARSIATLLQRVGRAGHGVTRLPKGRLFPLTLDELAEAAALLTTTRRGELDLTPSPPPALDILVQQVVAACVAEDRSLDGLFELARRSYPYRDLSRDDFDNAVDLHTSGRLALLHRDGVHGMLRATRRARLPALTSGGAIPDTADYQVRLEPEGHVVGTLNEDFAVEANRGDIFQLGNTSWRILRVEPGVVRVADAQGEPPSLPFWLGEAPSRTRELSGEIARQREESRGASWLAEETGLGPGGAEQLAAYIQEGRRELGGAPSQKRVIAERFFDETGGMQLVLHAPFGGRINRAWGLALRKTFCRGFGFELQAAANEEAVLLSLGPHHSFPLADVFKFVHSASASDKLVQALVTAPVFTTRWRWNATRSLALPRTRGGKKVPPVLLRMRADDLLAAAFPDAVACGENLPAGDLNIPMEHPLVRQTVDDCLHENMDGIGFLEVLRGLESGEIEVLAVDRPEPSVFALGILSAQPYTFLDDAPLEERRTQAVARRRGLRPELADTLGELDPEAVARVSQEAWPDPADAEELHEALLWMGCVFDHEVDAHKGWRAWLEQLAASGRVVREEGTWFATEASRDPLDVWRGRLEALGPVESDDPALAQLEAEGVVLRTRVAGRDVWCNRRLLARIHQLTLRRLRSEIEPVDAADLLRFLLRWQHVEPGRQLAGPLGVLEVVRQLAGYELPSAKWESSILKARVQGYRPGWLDELMLSGQLAFGRLWGAGTGPAKGTPVSLVPREDLDDWLGLAPPGDPWSVKGEGSAVLEVLQQRGACFPQELLRHTRLLAPQLDAGLGQLVGLGLATCDGFGGLRALYGRRPVRRRRGSAPAPAGRWSLLHREGGVEPEPEFVARQLLRRWGVVFKRVLERERIPIPWWKLLRSLRLLEVRGEVRGGRFVGGFSGEQFALPEAVEQLRATRRDRREERGRDPVSVSAADPLNLAGILTPDERVSSASRQQVIVG
ncbi:MAG: ATP-dependent DNA helicase [Planctomycetota bacterium]|nr:MAG: ATP-dependent DNA helicase [Planctomycetota bacterium]